MMIKSRGGHALTKSAIRQIFINIYTYLLYYTTTINDCQSKNVITAASVGLSMMCYTFSRKDNLAGIEEMVKELARRFPTERTHRKVVVFLL